MVLSVLTLTGGEATSGIDALPRHPIAEDMILNLIAPGDEIAESWQPGDPLPGWRNPPPTAEAMMREHPAVAVSRDEVLQAYASL